MGGPGLNNGAMRGIHKMEDTTKITADTETRCSLITRETGRLVDLSGIR